MQVKKQQLELDMEQQTGSKLGKEHVKAVLSPCLFNLYAEYIMRNTALDEAQAGIKITRRNINTSDMQRLLIFLLEILIPACASSSLAFRMMYSACKLNRQGDNRQPRHIPFPIGNQSFVPCAVLTVAS